MRSARDREGSVLESERKYKKCSEFEELEKSVIEICRAGGVGTLL